METTLYKLDADLTFNSVITVRSKLLNVLKTSKPTFCLDLSKVTHCDSAGLALLIDAKKLCKKHGKVLKMIGVSHKTQSLAEFCGVNDILTV